MHVLKMPLCYRCKHYSSPYFCKAYPNGIPDILTIGVMDQDYNGPTLPAPLTRVEHTEPYEGDNGIVFEPISEDEYKKREDNNFGVRHEMPYHFTDAAGNRKRRWISYNPRKYTPEQIKRMDNPPSVLS